LPPSLNFALETLVSDIISKEHSATLSRWLRSDAASNVRVNALVAGSGQLLEENLLRGLRSGYDTFKMKVGVSDPAEDLERIKSFRDLACDDIRLRLDANRSFSYDQAREFLTKIATYDIEYVEEPLRDEDIGRLDELGSATGVPIAVDETVAEARSIMHLLNSGSIKAAIVKPTLIGGISSCLQIARQCVEADKKVVITSTFEAGVGVAACLHIAAMLGGELASGLSTLGLLKDTLIEETLVIESGHMKVPDSPGIGVTPSEPRNGKIEDVELEVR
jgi:O-succinylbenzoate synthase